MDYSHEELIEVKDWVYVCCTLVQTFLAMFALFWWERRNRKEDEKRNKRKAEEEKRRATTDKIVTHLSTHLNKAEEAYQILKDYLRDLDSKKIHVEFTQLDVLMYMFRNNIWRFDGEFCGPAWKSGRRTRGACLENITFELREITDFFKKFAIQLHSFDKECPDHIKGQFSTTIIEMGLLTLEFLPGNREQEIKKVYEVLHYFGYIHFCHLPDVALKENKSVLLKCKQCCCPFRRTQHSQGSSGNRRTKYVPARYREDYEIPDENTELFVLLHRLQEACHCHDESHDSNENKTKREIPYIEYFQYKNGKMDCIIECNYPNLKNFEQHIKSGKRQIINKENEIKGKISELLGTQAATEGDLLHYIRIVMVKIVTEEFKGKEAQLDAFIAYVKKIDCELVTPKERLCQSQRALNHIKKITDELEGAQKHILHLDGTSEFLEMKIEEFEQFIASKEVTIKEWV